jgi:hypothetical protein
MSGLSSVSEESADSSSKVVAGYHRGSDSRDLLWYHFDTDNKYGRRKKRMLEIIGKSFGLV